MSVVKNPRKGIFVWVNVLAPGYTWWDNLENQNLICMGTKKRSVAPQRLTEEHHRRPRSIGGTDASANISNVDPDKHKAWHTLYGNMNAFQIRDSINEEDAPEKVKVICRFINGSKVTEKGGQHSKNKNKRKRAKALLFGSMSFTERISYINSVWLDCGYHLYLRSK